MLSVPHLIIIFVIALIFFGPEKLPELARNLGKVMAEFKRATGDLRSTLEDHMRELEREASDRKIGGGTAGRPPQKQTSNPPEGAKGESMANALPAAPGSVTAEPPYLTRTATPTESESPKDEPQQDSSEKAQPDTQIAGNDRKNSS